MPFTSDLQGDGDWSAAFHVPPPAEIVTRLNPGGRVLFIPSDRIPDVESADPAALLAQTHWAGLLLRKMWRRNAMELEISGAGMSWLLGDSNRNGPRYSSFTSSGGMASVLSAALDPVFDRPLDLHLAVGNLFDGHRAYPAGSVFDRSVRELLDTVTTTCQGTWRVNPDGTIDAGKHEDLYPAVPEVLFSNEPGMGGQGEVLLGVDGDLSIRESYYDYGTSVFIEPQAGVTTRREQTFVAGFESPFLPSSIFSEASGNPTEGYVVSLPDDLIPDYSAPDGRKLMRAIRVEGFQAAADTAGQVAVATLLAARKEPRVTINATFLTSDGAATLIKSGHKAAVWVPLAGLSNYEDRVLHKGDYIHPDVYPVSSVTLPITDMWSAVYMNKDGDPGSGGYIMDLTPHIKKEADGATARIGDLKRNDRDVLSGTSARVGKPAVTFDVGFPASAQKSFSLEF